MSLMPKLKWKRSFLRLILDSQYEANDGGDKYRVLRNRKTGHVKMFIWRNGHEHATEVYDYLPSIKLAKRLAESRRQLQTEQACVPGANNPLVWR